MTNLDQSICFLKNSRHIECLLFTDIIDSVKSTFGRDMNVNIFRQLLSIVPELYKHEWVNQKLTIDSSQDLQLNSVMQNRIQILK